MNAPNSTDLKAADTLVIAGVPHCSRLLTAYGKPVDSDKTFRAAQAAAAWIVTVASLRANICEELGDGPNLVRLAVQVRRAAFKPGRTPRKRFASASSPVDGLID